MDVQITVITGGGKKANRESKSYTIKEVQTKAQVIEALDEKFGAYFSNVQTLTEVKPRSKEEYRIASGGCPVKQPLTYFVMINMIMRTEEEIRKVIDKTCEALPETTTYIDGVRDALRWVLGGGCL